MDDIAAVTSVLDPLLTRLGFAAGQGGPGTETSGDIIWCAAYAEFAPRFDWLPQAHDLVAPAGTECVDLTVGLTLGRVDRLDLESSSLPQTFDRLGDPDRGRATADLLGAPAGAAAQALAPLLATLFRVEPTARDH